MVSFCVASEAGVTVPELMALIPPLICGIAGFCALACLAVTLFVAKTSATTRPVPASNPVSAIKRLRIPAHLLLSCWVFSACRGAACGASGRNTALARGFAAEMTGLEAGADRSVITRVGYAALRR